MNDTVNADLDNNTDEIDVGDNGFIPAKNPFELTSAETYRYPLNLSSEDSSAENPEQLHSVLFQINARESSRVAAKQGGNLAPDNKEFIANKTEQNKPTSEQLSLVSTGVAGFAGAAAGVSVIKSITSGKGSVMATALATAGGAYLAYKLKEGTGVIETVNTIRTLGMIELYISQPPVAKYSANWENKELGALAGLGAKAQDSSGFVDMIKSNVSGVGELAFRGAIQAAAQLPSQLGLTGEIGAALNLASSKVANPYKAQLFNSIGFRQFAFAYKFAPRNSTEYDNVKKIIQLFKYHMHPENDPTGLFLEYPSEFDIKYLYRGDENKELSKISTCALTDMKITYGNQDAFTTVKSTNHPGAPAEINIELAFTELETLTSKRIQDGF